MDRLQKELTEALSNTCRSFQGTFKRRQISLHGEHCFKFHWIQRAHTNQYLSEFIVILFLALQGSFKLSRRDKTAVNQNFTTEAPGKPPA